MNITEEYNNKIFSIAKDVEQIIKKYSPKENYMEETLKLLYNANYKSLNPHAKNLYQYMRIWSYVNGGYAIEISIAQIMNTVGMSVKTAVGSIKELVNKGFIKRLNDSKTTREKSKFVLSDEWISLKAHGETITARNDSETVGYIYVIKMGDNYKIGKSKKPKERLIEFTKMPQAMKKILCVKVKDYDDAEKHLHDKYVSKHVRGEWYLLAREDIRDIKNYLMSIAQE